MPDCSVEGCGRSAKARGWCGSHWARWRKHGDPLGGGTEQGAPQRFLYDVVFPYQDRDTCLTWPYSTINGYGCIRIKGRTYLVHKLACDEEHGPPPTPRHQAAHSCGKGKSGCVSRHHLSWKTRPENEADKVIHGTSNRGERQHLSKLTEGDVRAIRAMRGERSHSEIAEMFGVTPSLISMVQTGRAWGWLPQQINKGE